MDLRLFYFRMKNCKLFPREIMTPSVVEVTGVTILNVTFS